MLMITYMFLTCSQKSLRDLFLCDEVTEVRKNDDEEQEEAVDGEYDDLFVNDDEAE